jgi:L-Ala-D/L-Glu epimerase
MTITDLHMTSERWPLRQPFRFAGFTVDVLDTVHVAVTNGVHSGQGEGVLPIAVDVAADPTSALLGEARTAILSGQNAWSTCAAMPPGPARNALDCALWDLRAKTSGRSVWDQADLPHRPASLQVDQSIGLATPDEMAAIAAASDHAVLKLKLDSTLIVERVAAVRAVRSDATIIVDANQSWSLDALVRHGQALADLGVAMIEQPLRRDADQALSQLRSPVPLYADESCHTTDDLPRLAKLYQGVNIKLDKTGGLTEALALARAARDMGLGLMVGCMAGTSLSMAPAYLIASLSRWSDLDGPLLLAGDRSTPMRYRGGELSTFTPALWG